MQRPLRDIGRSFGDGLIKIPIAHIGGGDVTEGSIDNKLRYAITVLSDLHFVTNKDAARRILNFVTPDVVHYTGSPALDRIAETPLLDEYAVFVRCDSMDLERPNRIIFVIYHAELLNLTMA